MAGSSLTAVSLDTFAGHSATMLFHAVPVAVK